MQLDAFVYSIPLRTKFRGITSRDGVLLRGPAGWAEVSPFWDYGIEESSAWLSGALDAACAGYPAAKREKIPVNVTVPAVGPDAAARIAREGNCATAKVKIAEPGQSVDDDVARLVAVRSALPSAKIRVDVNGKWTVAEALERIPILNEAAGGLEYVEQPCASVTDLAKVRAGVDVPIAADESIRRAADPFEVKRLGAADIVILKNQPLGGVRRALEIAEQIELPVVVSSALESSVGLRAGVALAAALDDLPHACGLATIQLFDHDVVTESLRPVDGYIDVPGDQTVRPEALTWEPEICGRWQERIARMVEFLESREAVGKMEKFSIRFPSLREADL